MCYTFNSIAGYETEKEELKRICETIKNREKYLEKGAKLPKGIIFYGEAGTGKTLFTKVLADECGLYTYQIDISNLDSSVQICRRIRRAFEKASKRKEPSMIFFDELDKLLPNDNEEYYTDQSKTILAQLLTLIDGMDSSNNFIFVATCNYYNSLPETLVRPGRIDKKINIGKPDFASRVEVLNYYVSKSACKFETSVEEIAKLCSGFTCSALETLVNECIIRSDENNFVSKKLVTEKVFEVKREDIPRKSSNVSDTVTACRNIGFFIVARSFNNGKYLLNLENDNLCNGYFNKIMSYYDEDYNDDGFDDDEETDEYVSEDGEDDYECFEDGDLYCCKTDLLNTICVLFGGYAAEKIVFNKTYDNLRCELSNINSILFDMSSQGMFGIENTFYSWRNKKMPYPAEYVERLNYIFENTISDCYKKAENIISNNKELIEKLIPILVEKRYMDNLVGELILEDLGGIKT